MAQAKRNIDDNQAIRLFNTSAYDLFSNSRYKLLYTSLRFIKSALMSMLSIIGREYRFIFHCDFYLKFIDWDVFKKFFPATYDIWCLDDLDKRLLFSRTYEKWRNILAHAYISIDDHRYLEKPLAFLNFPNNVIGKIKYLDNDRITIGGMFFLVLNSLSHPQRIYFLQNLSYLHLIFDQEPQLYHCYGKNDLCFTDQNLKFNYKSKNLLDGLTQNFKENVIELDNNKFELKFGSKGHPFFNVVFSIDANQITIYSGSITNFYYKDNYTIEIENMNEFLMELGKYNLFVYIDYLAYNNIHVFDLKQKKNIDSLLSIDSHLLNNPSFYGVSNLYNLNYNTVDRISNIVLTRIVNTSIREILDFLVNYRQRSGKRFSNNFSKFSNIMRSFQFSKEDCSDLVSLRNAAMHDALINSWFISGSDGTCIFYDFNFISSCLYKILKHLESTNHSLYKELAPKIFSIVGQLEYEIYQDVTFNHALYVLKNFPSKNKKEPVYWPVNWIDGYKFPYPLRLNLDLNPFYEIYEEFEDSHNSIKKIAILYIEGIEIPLFLCLFEVVSSYLSEFIKRHDFKIIKEEDDKLFRYIYLEKNH